MKNDAYLGLILAAKVYDVAVESPLDPLPSISRRTANHVLLKREDKQAVFSFKLRGAYNKMANLSPARLARGVTCAIAGNHAQGVALAAQRLGVPATVVMPVTTPRIKVSAVSSRGARGAHGDSYHEAYLHARALARRSRSTFAPYDDPLVIADRDHRHGDPAHMRGRSMPSSFPAAVVIAGVAAYVKRVSPRTRVIGVEPVDSAAMFQSLKAGKRVTLAHVNLFADGVAVRQVGRETLRLAKDLVDEMVLVDTDEICAAIKDVFEDTRTVLEPAGALALAGGAGSSGARRRAARRATPAPT
jgi:threonine dehydratase